MGQPCSPRPCPGSPRSLSHAGVPVPLPAGAQCSPLSADAGRWAAPLVVPPLGLPRFRPTGSRWSTSGGDPLRSLRSVEGLRPLLFCWLLSSGNPLSSLPSLSLSACSPEYRDLPPPMSLRLFYGPSRMGRVTGMSPANPLASLSPIRIRRLSICTMFTALAPKLSTSVG